MMQRPYYDFNPALNPGFGPQTAYTGFSGAFGPSPQMNPASAPAPVSAPTTAGFGVQPVSSREEALAVIADPLSAGVLLPDLGHGVVYMKRFNPNTGASDFAEFAFVQPKAAESAPAPAQEELVTLSVFNSTVEKLRSEIAAMKGGGKSRKEAAPDE